MSTNEVIDQSLMKKAMNYTGLRTKKDVVHFALEEIVSNDVNIQCPTVN